MSCNCLRAIACQLTTNCVRKFLEICGMKGCKHAKLVALLSSSSIVLIVLIAYVSPVVLNTTNPKLSVWEIALLVGGGMKFKGSAGSDQLRILIDSGPDSSLTVLANTINNAFLAPMNSFSPLHPKASGAVQHINPPTVTEFWVLKKLTGLNPA